VQVGPGGVQAEPLPDPVHQQQRGDLVHPLLDRHQADQLLVQVGQDVVDPRGLPFVTKADGRLGRQGRLTPSVTAA
jgi:hypothetical protein